MSSDVTAYRNVYNNFGEVYGNVKPDEVKQENRIYLTIKDGHAETTNDKTKAAGLGAIIDLADKILEQKDLAADDKRDVFFAVYYSGLIGKELGPNNNPEEIEKKMKDPEVQKLNTFFEKHKELNGL